MPVYCPLSPNTLQCPSLTRCAMRGKKVYFVHWCAYPTHLNSTWNPEGYRNAVSQVLPFSPRLNSFLPQSPDTCCSFCLEPSLPLILHISAHTSLPQRGRLWSPHLKHTPSSCLFVPLSCFIFFIILSHFQKYLIDLFAYYCMSSPTRVKAP